MAHVSGGAIVVHGLGATVGPGPGGAVSHGDTAEHDGIARPRARRRTERRDIALFLAVNRPRIARATRGEPA